MSGSRCIQRIQTVRMEGMNRNRRVLRHTAEENARTIVKAPCIQRRFVMPLAHTVRSIARCAQKLRKRWYPWIHRVRRNIVRIQTKHPKQTSSSQQHGPTRHAHSGRSRTHDVRMRQGCARSNQTVKSWRRNRRRSQRTNRIVPMVVSNEEKKVGWHDQLVGSMKKKVEHEHSELAESARPRKNSAYRLHVRAPCLTVIRTFCSSPPTNNAATHLALRASPGCRRPHSTP